MKFRKFALVLAAFTLLATGALASEDRLLAGPGIAVVQTKSGALQGYVRGGIFVYRGVPYAEAERFMPPHAVSPWQGVRLALADGPVSLQSPDPADDIFPPHWFWPHWQPHHEPMADNCQNLNVWTPGLDGKKRPVMVWLHGGGYSMGSATVEDVYDGENLSRTGDVVVVSVNHRLNSVGFLDLSAYGDKYKDSAHSGMLDIIAALEWVRDNIESFGGDPGNVTVFGQSGGGAKILTLMAMPAARGLFHKAIPQSGFVPLMSMTLPLPEATRRVAELVLEELGLTPERVDELQTMPYDTLFRAANRAFKKATEELGPTKLHGGLGWAPVMDGRNVACHPAGPDGFSPLGKDVPMLAGTVLNEWTTIRMFAAMGQSQHDNLNTWSDEEARKRLTARFGDRTDAVVAAHRAAWPEKKDAAALYVDTGSRNQLLTILERRVKLGGAPVYNYIFSWDTPVMGGYALAYHCSELPFVFNNIALAEMATGAGKEAFALAEKMSRAWVNFARTGNPNGEGLPEWPAWTSENGAVMIFDNECVVRNHPDKELQALLTGK
ncbi:MAG: carboxylesterase/lipase family protein [Pyramidobacter sp.]|nr:carboxylesterase/lipase family protein [Pyramidobacter sp.]